jgi:hypothetical protein
MNVRGLIGEYLLYASDIIAGGGQGLTRLVLIGASGVLVGGVALGILGASIGADQRNGRANIAGALVGAVAGGAIGGAATFMLLVFGIIPT